MENTPTTQAPEATSKVETVSTTENAQQSVQTPAPVQTKKGMSTGMKVLLGVGGCVVLLIVCVTGMFALGIAGLGKVAQEVDKQVKEDEKKAEESFKNPKAIGQKVTVGKIEWTIIKAENLGATIKASNEFYDDCVATTGSSFVKVTFKVKNTDSEMVSLTDLDLVDSAKREFKDYTGAFTCLSSQDDDTVFVLENINPGLEKTFTAYYEVPNESKELRVKLGDLEIFSDKYDYVSLGL